VLTICRIQHRFVSAFKAKSHASFFVRLTILILVMRLPSNFLSILFLTVCFVICNDIPVFCQKGSPSAEIIVKFKTEHRPKQIKCSDEATLCMASFESLNKSNISIKAKEIAPQILNNTFRIQIESDENVDDIISEYQNSGLFEYVENNFIQNPIANNPAATIPNESTFSQQWAFKNTGTMEYVYSIDDADIDMELAWTVEQGNAGITVAVMDTGIDYTHPDLANRMWTNYGEIAGNGIDDDNNGYVDDHIGYDFAESDNDPDDINGHGTLIAGIIGAEPNNNSAYAGVDWNCKIMPLKVIRDNMTSSYSDYVEAIYYAVTHGARVINLSLTSYHPSTALDEAFAFAHAHGVVLVVAMGNNGNTTVHHMAKSIYSIAVGATTPADKRSNFSCYNDYIDVVAPGSYIYGLNKDHHSDTYFSMSGTSQAAPHVAGLASLLIAQDPSRLPEDIRQIITSTAQDMVGPSSEDIAGFDHYFGHGRINAYDALTVSSGDISFHAEASETNTESNEIPLSQDGCTAIIESSFDNGFGIWNSGGVDVELSAKYGNSIKLMDNSGVHSSIFTPTMDLRGQSSVSVDFKFTPVSMETGEDFMFEYSIDGGSTFIPLKSWVSKIDFQHKVQQDISFNAKRLGLTEQTVFRFRCDASSNTDVIYLEQVNITVCATESALCDKGTRCDDGDACTINDSYNSSCDCVGTYEDMDNDGVCSAEDIDDFDSCIPHSTFCDEETEGTSNGHNNCESFIYSDFNYDGGMWSLGGRDARINKDYIIDGDGSAQLRDNSKEGSSIFTQEIDFSNIDQLKISFEFFAVSMELGEDFMFEVSTDAGQSFIEIQKWISGIDFKNSERHLVDFVVDKKFLSSHVILRFRCDASSNADIVYLDNIDIQKCKNERSDVTNSFVSHSSVMNNSVMNSSVLNSSVTQSPEFDDIETLQDVLTVYPNPSVDFISIKNIQTPVTVSDVYIFTLDGTQVYHSQFSVDDELRIDVSALQGATQYLVRVVTPQSKSPVTATFFKV